MRCLIVGGHGQLGSFLAQQWSADQLLMPRSDELDVGSVATIEQIITAQPDLVLLPGAYTNVDGCTEDPEKAFRVNTLGPKYVALACRALDIPLVYVSTNEVFAGTSTTGYREYDHAAPINAYGRSKWGGEQAVLHHAPMAYIVRVAWLFGGERNFIRTMLRLGRQNAETGQPLRVVADEIGNPTYAADAAIAIRQLVNHGIPGTYHIVNQGWCSRFDLAQAALETAGIQVAMEQIKLADFKRPSTPPPATPLINSAAAHLGITLRPWREAVDAFVHTIQHD